MDFDIAGDQIDGFAVAGQIIGAFALNFDGRELRRHLCNHPDKLRQNGLDLGLDRSVVAGGNRFAFGVVGIGFNAPADGETIGFFAVHHIGHGFGGFAESQW